MPNNTNKLILIPPEVLFALDLKLNNILFFGLQGWLLKKNLKTTSIIRYAFKYLTLLILPLTSVIRNLIFGLLRGYFKYVQLKGRSFKYILWRSSLILKFGFSHKIYYTVLNNVCITLVTKQLLKIISKTAQKVSVFFFDLHSIRKFDKYKGKGVLYYKDSIILKASSKKIKA
jgi:ribosomal protein L6P/L9E